MILYGAGGHAEVVYDCLLSQGQEVTLVFDDDHAIKKFKDQNVITQYKDDVQSHEKMIISIGSNRVRYELSKIIAHKFGTAIHKTAHIADGVVIQEGSMIMAKSIVQTGCKMGKHTIINSGAIVEHRSGIGDFVHIGPGAVVCGRVIIGQGALIGANSTILPGIKIGDWSIIGAGSVVCKNVEKNSTVVGNPARCIKK